MFFTALDLETPELTRVSLYGDLDCLETDTFLKSIRPLVPKTQSLEIDLSELEFLDTTGLAAFVSLWQELDATGGSFRLVNVNDSVRRKLALTGLDSVLPVHPPSWGL